MDLTELLEEIRTLLREAQADTVSTPWNYTNDEIIIAVRSGLRYLRSVGVTASGVPLAVTLSAERVMTGTLPELHGVLLAHLVASRLVQGDLMQKLRDGELGVAYRAGNDSMDTTGAVRAFQQRGDAIKETFQNLLTIALSTAIDGTSLVIGQSTPVVG